MNLVSPLSTSRSLGKELRRACMPFSGDAVPDRVMRLLRKRRFALIGEASHGTRDFYELRASMTRGLIEEGLCDAVVVEGDWPDAARVDRYVRGQGSDASAEEALRDFQRFPTWMWRNRSVAGFVDWLRRHNDGLPEDRRVGFHGMDLYSLFKSIGVVLAYLDRVDPEAAARARSRYGCLDQFADNVQAYGYAAAFGLRQDCEDAVVAQLAEMARRTSRDADAFEAQQNARLAANAERYYRTMFRGRVESWNVRDRHMAETLDALDARLGRPDRKARLAVWAHNSHLGDARATDMGAAGETNVGALMRERHGRDCACVGFTTFHGEVMAASDWDAPHFVQRARCPAGELGAPPPPGRRGAPRGHRRGRSLARRRRPTRARHWRDLRAAD